MIVGPNGSGKSTLLQILAGALTHSEGKITYRDGTGPAPLTSEAVFHQLSLAAPYLELIEEFTLLELLRFHQQFKPFIRDMPLMEIIRSVELEKAAHKEIRYFSSGMKQRAKLAQAIFSTVPLLLLDEPCTNLDAAGVRLYHDLMERYTRDRLVVISSNDPAEYDFCDRTLQLTDYKS